jgi:Family of unknown function (DUF6941)
MSNGPYLSAALLCERVMEEKDKVLTAFRITDSTTITLPPGTPDDFPSETNRLPVTFDSLVSLKTGKSPGEHTVRIDMISPSGKRSESETRTLTLPDEEHGGANLIHHHTVSIKQGGLFYFEVLVDGELLTRVPFRIDVIRQSADQFPQPPEIPTTEIKDTH